jgi:hypothetical protein
MWVILVIKYIHYRKREWCRCAQVSVSNWAGNRFLSRSLASHTPKINSKPKKKKTVARFKPAKLTGQPQSSCRARAWMRVSCYEKARSLLLLFEQLSPKRLEQTDFVFSHTQFFGLVMFSLGPGRTQFIVLSVWTGNHSLWSPIR